ncbi:MAG: sigma-70 family RNA polymerase sigma factor, partial [Armatimonadetes bacterium]|nr:sigma-70 family RNA polymerase sigma factor [Armatimonadota bacterium]
MAGATDGELVGQTRGGDREAYGELVARYQGHVYGLAYSLVDNWVEAQDIAQEAFIRAYVNLDQLREPERFAAWLRRVAFSVGMNWMKARRPDLFVQLEGRVDLDTLEIPDFRPGPPEVVERRELAQAVLGAVGTLPPKYRVPLTMFHLDGLSYQKVADFLDIPVGTAKSLIHRARAKLKAALAAYAEEVGPMVQEVFDEHKLPAEFARRVLDGVPTLAWGRGRECTFAGALEAALATTDHPYTYTDLLGFTGLALRTRWFCG